MNDILVKNLTTTDKQRWDEFVRKRSDATFFHLAGWKFVIEKAFSHPTYYLFTERNGEITGILPLAHIKSRIFGNNLSSLPFAVYGGIIASDTASQQLLEEKALEIGKSLSVEAIEYRNLQTKHADWPSKNLYVTFRKTIDPDVEQNMKNIPRKQRAMVRKGIDAGLVSETDNTVDRFYEAYAQSVHALGTPVFSKYYFECLKSEFSDQCEILTITKEGRLIASVMSFYFRDQVLPYYGGGTSEAREVKGNDFMYWELMRRSCEKGIKVFDYGRSKIDSGAYSFKKNWGFEPEPLHYEYVLVSADSVPEINPNNPKYKIFINLWKKLPFWATKIIGPHIVKYTG